MASEVKLNCYTVQVRERNKKNTENPYLPLNEVRINGEDGPDNLDFKEFFSNFIQSFGNIYKGIVTAAKNVVNLSSDNVKFGTERRIIYGFYKAGKTGHTRNISKVDEADGNIFTITPDLVDSNEYFFLLWLPADSNLGLLILQGYSTESSFETFVRLFKRFFSGNADGQVMDIKRFVPKVMIDMIKEKGEIDQLKLTKKRLSPDMANNVLGVNWIDDDVQIEIKVTGLSSWSEKIKDTIKGQAQFLTSDILDHFGMDDEYDLAYEYKFNGKATTVKQSQNFELKPTYYVDEKDITRDKNTSLPTKESLTRYCLEFFESLREGLTPN